MKKEIKEMLQKGQTEQALSILDTLISSSSNPDDELFYLRGNAYRKSGNWQAALHNYMEAIAINPQSPAAEAKQMVMDILEFYHKDLYNP